MAEPEENQADKDDIIRQLRARIQRAEAENERLQPLAEKGKTLEHLTLEDFLVSCHKLFHNPEVGSHLTSTKGDVTFPTGRPYPLRIVEVPNFAEEQAKALEHLFKDSDFCSRKLFSSQARLELLHQSGGKKMITSERDVESYAWLFIEQFTQELVAAMDKELGLQGQISIQNHTNMPSSTSETTTSSTIEEGMEQLSIARSRSRVHKVKQLAKAAEKILPKRAKPQNPAKDESSRMKTGPADEFCYLVTNGEAKKLIMMIEYKAPHKFLKDIIMAGLEGMGEIRPQDHIFGKDGIADKRAAVAVIVQLYASMLKKGVRFGYVCTAQANIFIEIEIKDPSLIHYGLSIPNAQMGGVLPYMTDVAQVTSFVLKAMKSECPGPKWNEKARDAPLWPQELEPLPNFPPTPERENQKKDQKGSEYKLKSKDIKIDRSVIKTRSKKSCQDPKNAEHRDRNDDGDDHRTPPNTPSPEQRRKNPNTAKARSGSSGKSNRTEIPAGSRDGNQNQAVATPRPHIRDRPYCTHRCLLGIVNGWTRDEKCPNIADHPVKHITKPKFHQLIRNQLDTDRGDDADCVPIFLHGACGVLFKVRLSSHGYTMVAKAVRQGSYKSLENEQRIYNHIRSIQGTLVPVCLGTVNLGKAQYYEGNELFRMLFLSWAGRSLRALKDKYEYEAQATAAYKTLHKVGVVHHDAALRNMLVDGNTQNLMIVDFERSEIMKPRQPLGVITLNRKEAQTQDQKKKNRDIAEDKVKSKLSAELRELKHSFFNHNSPLV